jgi:hypothetical protein
MKAAFVLQQTSAGKCNNKLCGLIFIAKSVFKLSSVLRDAQKLSLSSSQLKIAAKCIGTRARERPEPKIVRVELDNMYNKARI